MDVLGGDQTSPGDHGTRSDPQDTAVTHHDQERSLTICLVGDRVTRQDIVRALSNQVTPLQCHGIEKRSTGGLKLHPVALNVRDGQNELRSLEGGDYRSNVTQHGFQDCCIGLGAINDLHLKLISRCLLEDIRKGLGLLGLGLALREVELDNSI